MLLLEANKMKSLSDICDYLQEGIKTARRLNASDAKLIFKRAENNGCDFQDSRLKTIYTKKDSSYTITVIVDGRSGTASGNDLDDIDEMVERAASLARVGNKVNFESYPLPAEIKKVKTYSEKTASLTMDKMIESCQTIVDGLMAYNPELTIMAYAGKGISEKAIVTSGGVCHTSRNTHWWLGSGVQRTRGTDVLLTGYGRNWKDLNEFYDPHFILNRIIENLSISKTNVEPPKGKVPAFLDYEILDLFLLPIIKIGINGRNVAKGDSPLKGKLKEQILDPSITVIDDPHLDYSSSTVEIDEDGIPTQVIPIINEGFLENFLYDLDSAGLAQAKPTGNDGCSPYSPKVLPGQKSSRDLLASIKDGLYIKSIMGFTQGDIMNGDFSGNVALGFRIKDGEIVGRVKDTMVAGNVYELLKKNVELSSDYEPMRRLPFAVINGINVVS